jgi:hypothetical protein
MLVIKFGFVMQSPFSPELVEVWRRIKHVPDMIGEG